MPESPSGDAAGGQPSACRLSHGPPLPQSCRSGLAVTAVSPPRALPLKQAGTVPLPSDGSGFDYASLDPAAGLLFIAHLGASQVIEVDVRAGHVVRTIDGISDVHGVLTVPAPHRVYASATGANTVVALDEDTGAVLFRAPTGDFPDGIAYDPAHGTIWTTNESGGTETVVDAATGQARGTVDLGGEAGNNIHAPATGRSWSMCRPRTCWPRSPPRPSRSPAGWTCPAATTTTA